MRIGLAVESGSRAWGFPSPDSDYDCRFLYVRSTIGYLTPWPPRDVIETPLDGELDVNGWDLGKALKLLLKGNATVLEWLRSPIVYRGDAAFRAALLDFAEHAVDREAIQRHYLSLGRRQHARHAAGDAVALKGLFYALRPAACLRWLRLHPTQAVPPMDLPSLLATSDPPVDVAAEVAALTALKAVTREMGEGPLPPALAAFMSDEFARAADAVESGSVTAPERDMPALRAAAEALFRRLL